MDLKELYLEDGKVFIDPFLIHNGVLNVLRKKRIIKDICTTVNYNYIDIPVAILNMGILRQYDYLGVEKHLEKVTLIEQ